MKLSSHYFCFLMSILLLLCACSGADRTTGALDGASVSWEGFTMARASDQNLSNGRMSKYRKDAEKLAVRFINNRDSIQTKIPEALINLFYNGLIHIVNADHPEAEEATDPEYEVHALTPPDPRALSVGVNTGAPWLDAWRKGNTETGNEEVDDLLNEFDLTLVDYHEFASSPTANATLQSEYAINVYAVGRLFEQIPYIDYATAQIVGDGSDIKVLLFDNHLRYTLEYGFGDCPAGCINRHKWTFKVFRDGHVEFVSEGGSPLS